jgi:hypothetical protein
MDLVDLKIPDDKRDEYELKEEMYQQIEFHPVFPNWHQVRQKSQKGGSVFLLKICLCDYRNNLFSFYKKCIRRVICPLEFQAFYKKCIRRVICPLEFRVMSKTSKRHGQMITSRIFRFTYLSKHSW